MAQEVHQRHINNTVTPLPMSITQANESGTEVAVDLSSRTVSFRMVDALGETVIAETTTGVTVTDAANGEVEFDFPSAGVDEVGVFYGYFNAATGDSQSDAFPAIQKQLKIIVHRD